MQMEIPQPDEDFFSSVTRLQAAAARDILNTTRQIDEAHFRRVNTRNMAELLEALTHERASTFVVEEEDA